MNLLERINKANNVYIIDDAFYMPQLKRSRRIWLYLPPEYKWDEKRYPVIYMHDGQNLFDEETAFGEEWGIDETMNAMKKKCLIVGIDNGQDKRITEYNFYDNEQHGKGEGKQYVQFIVDTLKPYIDRTYRTLAGREHTFTAGSSLGGLISFYASMYYPEVFGGAGIFSPAFWIVPHIVEETKWKAGQNKSFTQRFFFYAGEKEDESITEGMKSIVNVLRGYPQYQLKTMFDPAGEHNESTWRQNFPLFYKWINTQSKAPGNKNLKNK